ncbi:MAG TPA: hypothetical protein VFQ51_04125 [Vicinamibacteria bacterium]|nr:hypothetical protein [Vicinamibacteria bacterium]
MSPLGMAARGGFAVVVGFIGLGAAPPADMRTDLEAIGLALDRAVLQVSRPSRTLPGASRGYRLEGFGAMFVVAPRAVPVPAPSPTAEEREIAIALSQAAQELEQRLPRVMSEDMRLQLQQSLKTMRQTEAELRLREKVGRRAAGGAGEAEGSAPSPPPRTMEQTLQDLETDVQSMQRLQEEAIQAVRSDALGIPPEMRREIEAHIRMVNEQAAAFAQEAERARRESERQLWSRLGQEPPSPAVAGTPATAATAAAPPPAPGGAEPLPPDSTPAVLPPWRLWIDPMDDPTPDPEQVIRGVGDAVVSVLERQGPRLRVLAPQETIAVAIDFVPATRMGTRARPARTLLIRVRKVDVDQRAAGALTPAEFRKRVEVVEY